MLACSFRPLRLLQVFALIVRANAVFAASAPGTETFAFAVDLIRHGDRTPLANLPAIPCQSPEGSGQLTAIGARQEFDLGSKLRGLYIYTNQLLPTNYTAGTIYVRSTDMERTLMSAESLLLGLYPPGTGMPTLPDKFQPIPIHTVPKGEDPLIPDYSSSNYNRLLERFVVSTPEWKSKHAELEPNFPRWSDATGIRITNLLQLVSIGDTMFIDQIHDCPLPPGVSREEAQAIIESGRWVFTEIYAKKEISQTTGDYVLTNIAAYFKDSSKGTNPTLKYVLYSVHDSTLLSVMSVLGAPLGKAPPYAADLRFALFRSSENAFRVEISYSDQPAVIIPEFHGNSCSLAQFVAFVGARSSRPATP